MSTPITWSVTGPQGSQGVAGAKGDPGTAGSPGPPGAIGAAGPAGANGTGVLNGVGAPAVTLGSVGDFYVDTAANTLYGPKDTSATPWETGVSLTGPAGAPGAAGAAGAAGAPGVDGKSMSGGNQAPSSFFGTPGDFYLDTATHVLYGPAVTSCGLFSCTINWGAGTGLVGPPGPPGPGGSAGQGVAYDTYADSGTDGLNGVLNAIDVPSGARTRIITQTLPPGGSYEVVANLELVTGTAGLDLGGTGVWICDLVAANPGGSAVSLDGRATMIVGNGTMSLEGVVSIAAGGTIGINCAEVRSQGHDSVVQPHILTTQLSSFTSIAPG